MKSKQAPTLTVEVEKILMKAAQPGLQRPLYWELTGKGCSVLPALLALAARALLSLHVWVLACGEHGQR